MTVSYDYFFPAFPNPNGQIARKKNTRKSRRIF